MRPEIHRKMKNSRPAPMKKAVVLLSGGLDSTTVLYLAKKKDYQPYCLTFDYGQSHSREVESAKSIAKRAKVNILVLKISFPWKGSALLDKKISLPSHPLKEIGKIIPSTYVPSRNLVFLSFATSYAEVIGAKAIFIGANTLDFSGYPDCRPDFFQAFQRASLLGTKVGREGKSIKILTPLINKSKKGIIELGKKLKVPFHLTWSCYKGEKRPCGRCDSCLLREKGFKEAGLEDPLLKT